MLQPLREFRVGKPQIFAGLLLLAFLAQCLWAAQRWRFFDREFQYLPFAQQGNSPKEWRVSSPATTAVTTLTLRVTPAPISNALAIPHPWLFRLPFVIFGVWLGAALWWVARRLFGDEGGYVALGLYCFSPSMIMASSRLGPEIILAWSSFGLIYTSIGVAHTVYASPRKWVPRILLLGISIGLCLSAAEWSFTLVLLAFGFMLYLTPGRRGAVAVILGGASAIGLCICGLFVWFWGSPRLATPTQITPRVTWELVQNLWFALVDGYLVIGLLFLALAVYWTWPRARYFGNTAPLITSFLTVCLFTLAPATGLWNPVLGLSFVFVFIGGVAADLLETQARRSVAFFFVCGGLFRVVSTLILLGRQG
ncbi:MAG TPA: glycosyltransferase family 39 protein [Candidatus Angelobacter sp.]|jgi:hypothetical protein|nr:glycosyltransferase family 39 protein [Candidatus Angelobacter sp.]